MSDDAGGGQEAPGYVEFKTIYPGLWQHARRHIRRMNRTVDAEDMADEVMERVWKNWETLSDHHNLRPFVVRVATNLMIDETRRPVHLSLDSPEVGPGVLRADDDKNDTEMVLRQEIDRLPRRLREVMELAAFDELKPAEIAEVLDLPARTVTRYLTRARRELKKRIRPNESRSSPQSPESAADQNSDGQEEGAG